MCIDNNICMHRDYNEECEYLSEKSKKIYNKTSFNYLRIINK